MKLIAAILLSLLAPLAIASPSLAFNPFSNCTSVTNADGTTTKVCGPCANNPDAPTCNQASNQNKNNVNPVVHIINVAVMIMSILVGIFAVIMIIIGGLTMASSAGNSEKVAKARARVIYSVVALVVAALAWTIVTFVVNQITT